MSELTGILFNIVHGSCVDGHGVRTTVFLKGCPLRCLWCCNSEGQKLQNELKVSPDLCNACTRCSDICPENAIALKDGRITSIDRAKCTMCLKCVDVCYMDAIDTFGKEYTVDEIFDIVNKDKEYYIASGGGITIGGGEATMQPEFTQALIRKCQVNGIHVAIDTCGYTVSEKSLSCLEQADLLLYDLKGIAPEQHKNNTGVSNELILKNLQHLNDMGKEIIIRLPIIPGCTDSDENINATAELLSKLNSVIRVDLIAYHEYGKIKFDQRGETYPLEGTPFIGDERMNTIKKMLEDKGLTVQIGG